jgi:hypothetical protein
MMELQVNEREFHTILAALRFYQEHRQYDPAQRSAWIKTLATNCGGSFRSMLPPSTGSANV